MELVPFFSEWTGSETGLDLHAIYRRPGPGITLTTALPVRRHRDYQSRGFEYISLATAKDVNEAGRFLRERGIDPVKFKGSYRVDLGGAFDVAQYLKQAAADAQAELADLRALVEKFGPETVTEIKRQQNPDFVLPAEALPTAGMDVPKPGRPRDARGRLMPAAATPGVDGDQA